MCPHLFELPEGRDWPQSTSRVTPRRVQVPGVGRSQTSAATSPSAISETLFSEGLTISPWATSSTCKHLTASLGLKAPSLAQDWVFP